MYVKIGEVSLVLLIKALVLSRRQQLGGSSDEQINITASAIPSRANRVSHEMIDVNSDTVSKQISEVVSIEIIC